MADKIYDVLVPGSRAKFVEWIAERGGVQVWENLNISNPGGGRTFTPAFRPVGEPDANGWRDVEPYPQPHWYSGRSEVVKDIKRFRFMKRFKEVKRFRIALRIGAQGFMVKLTDASSRKVFKALDDFPGAVYRFEGREAVIELPEWEG